MTEDQTPPRTLLIGVDAAQQQQMAAALAARWPNHTLDAAADLAAATQYLHGAQPSVALVQLGADGLTALRTLRQAYPRVPLAILAGGEQDPALAEARAEGVTDYLIPEWLSGPIVERVLQHAIDNHRLQTDLALVDEITGLYTRHGFMAVAEQYLKLARRLHHSLVLTYLDIDGFTRIRAEHGPAEADWALRQVATLLRTSFRESDLMGRLETDAFAFFGMGSSDRSSEALEARLNDLLSKLAPQEGHPVHISLSAGMIWFDPENSPGLVDLLSQVEAGMQAHRRSKSKPAT